MDNPYYNIWMDAIAHEMAKKAEGRNVKLFSLAQISILQGINLLTFFYWMKVIVNRNLPLFLDIEIFNAHPINGFISVVVTLVAPFAMLNWLLIFNNDRYKTLLKKYPARNGKLFQRYALISLGLFIIPVIIQKAFFA